MNGLFSRIAARAAGTLRVAQPRVVTRFEQPALNAATIDTETSSVQPAAIYSNNSQLLNTVVPQPLLPVNPKNDRKKQDVPIVNSFSENRIPEKTEALNQKLTVTSANKETTQLTKQTTLSDQDRSPELIASINQDTSAQQVVLPNQDTSVRQVDLPNQVISAEQFLMMPDISPSNKSQKISPSSPLGKRDESSNLTVHQTGTAALNVSPKQISKLSSEILEKTQASAGKTHPMFKRPLANLTREDISHHTPNANQVVDNEVLSSAKIGVETKTSQTDDVEKILTSRDNQITPPVSISSKKELFNSQDTNKSQSSSTRLFENTEPPMPTITINIGTIDVRKQKVEPVRYAPPPAPPSRTMSLGDYLQKRKRGEL